MLEFLLGLAVMFGYLLLCYLLGYIVNKYVLKENEKDLRDPSANIGAGFIASFVIGGFGRLCYLIGSSIIPPK